MNTSDNKQAIYKDPDGKYIGGDDSILSAAYYAANGTDIFTTLEGIRQSQESIASMISALSGLKGNNFDNRVSTISETLDKDNGSLETVEIIQIPQMDLLKDMKMRLLETISNNRRLFITTVESKTIAQTEQDIINISEEIKRVSGINPRDYGKESITSRGFKIQTIDKIDSLKEKINKLDGAAAQLERLATVRREAFTIFNLIVDMEAINEKGKAALSTLEDIFNQTFGGRYKNKPSG